VLNDFVILDMAEDAYTQMILRRPFLASSGCIIDVKGGQLAFDVGEYHGEFSLFEDQKFYRSSFACGEMIISNVNVKCDELSPNNSHMFDYVVIEGLGLDCANVGLEAHLPPCTTKDEPFAVNDDSSSNYYRYNVFTSYGWS